MPSRQPSLFQLKQENKHSPNSAFQLDPGQQHGERYVILVQHATCHSIEGHLGTKQSSSVEALNSDLSKIIKVLHLVIKKLNLKEILCDD